MSALGTRTRLGYSLGSFVTGAFGTVPGLLLLPYLTDTLAVPAAAAGAIVLLPKAWDVVFNPVAGRLSDADLARRGSRTRSLVAGGLVLAVTFAALFAHPGFGSVGADSAYVVAVFFLCATAFAFFQVPFNALPAELTDGYHERTRLTTWRIAVLALAILTSGALAPAITNGIGGVNGYRVMGVFVAVLIVLGTVAVILGIRGVPVSEPRRPTASWRELVATMRRWRSFRLLLGVYFIQALGVATLLAAVSYVARYVLGDAGYQSLLFAGFVGPALLVMPLWDRVGRSGGKLAGFRVATVALSLALAGLVFARALPPAMVFVLAALAGVGYAGIQVFPLALLPDLITEEERRTGEARAGVTAGVWTAAEALGLALGPSLFGLVLSWGGYVSSTDAAASQPESAVTAITVGFSLLPAVLVALGLPLLRREVFSSERKRRDRDDGKAVEA
ncbi:MFS transporter [Saccharomonospora glauca]|uniref:Na+/melibiose symporter-like transporter n=1 Tax=Saccharomonospora glauca K62 TaxID=928724 RepID=I1D3A9_9PSEU|nr:MFS transporter [Saccharomonospora glauca]EIE99433.1 Na+/melibiose symporter-like transporter [Saccharomonospora glauca K62]